MKHFDLMRLSLSKLPTSQCGQQLGELRAILRFADADDGRVAVSAQLPAEQAACLPDQFVASIDWSRRISGTIPFEVMRHAASQQRLIDAGFRDSSGIEFLFSYSHDRPWHDWDGIFANRFLVQITHGLDTVAEAPEIFSRQIGINYRPSERYDGGQTYIVHGLTDIPAESLMRVFEWLQETYDLTQVKVLEATFRGALKTLPGFGETDVAGAVLESDVLFGEISRVLKVLNQNVGDVTEFNAAIRSLGVPFRFRIEREYLRWRTKAESRIRGTAGNAIRLVMNQSKSELSVEFEQFSDGDPEALELKNRFLSFRK